MQNIRNCEENDIEDLSDYIQQLENGKKLLEIL